MKLLLDTTYLLPVVGVNVKELAKGIPAKLTKKGHQVAISEITIFELSAKSAKYVAKTKLRPERVTAGIESLIRDESIGKIPVFEDEILQTAFKLRRLLGDFIDCLILSTAINKCEELVTEDNEINALKNNVNFCDVLLTTNQGFKIRKIADENWEAKPS